MNDGQEQFLAARLGELRAPTGEPDWADVRRKARRRATRRQTMRFGAAAAVALVSIVAATPAFGLRGQVGRLVGFGEPAPAPVVRNFAEMDVAAPPGMATGVIAGEAREVMEVRLSTGKSAVLWAAPTRSGGYCSGLSTEGSQSEVGPGCNRDRTGPRFGVSGISFPGGISSVNEMLERPAIIHADALVINGEALIPGATTVEIRYEDGDRAKVPVVWVSPPIDAGFFVYEIPVRHWAAGHRLSLLVLEDADGKELATDREMPRMLNEHERVVPRAVPESARPAGH